MLTAVTNPKGRSTGVLSLLASHMYSRKVALSLPPMSDHGAGLLPELAAQTGPCEPEQFMSAIGGLLPMALCGRTSL